MTAMALRSCVGSRMNEPLLQAVEEAIKDSAASRLNNLLSDGQLSSSELAHKSLLHQAAWLGHTTCVRLLLDYGASPDEPHRKNGCTPLHLAHFCTVVEDTNPGATIRTLVAAGADINNPGGRKCGKIPIDHAIQHQRIDSVQVLLSEGSQVTLQSVLISIDVANPRILELLLIHGGDCGRPLTDTLLFWGQPLHRALYSPLKCPRECYKQLFRLLVQATVCYPVIQSPTETPEPGAPLSPTSRLPSGVHASLETELRMIANDYVDLAQYLYAFLVRNGLVPSESLKKLMVTVSGWTDEYLRDPPTLRDVSIRTIRSYFYRSGNIMHAVHRLHLPSRLKNLILLINPF